MNRDDITISVINNLIGVYGFSYIDLTKYKSLVGINTLIDKIVYTNTSSIKIDSNINLGEYEFIIFKLKLQHIQLESNDVDCVKIVTDLFTHMINIAKHFSDNVSLFINSVNVIYMDGVLVLELFYNLFFGFSSEYDLNLNTEIDNIMDGNNDFLTEFKLDNFNDSMCSKCKDDCVCGYESGWYIDKKKLYIYNEIENRYENGYGEITYDYDNLKCILSDNMYYKLSMYCDLDYLNKKSPLWAPVDWVDSQNYKNSCLITILKYGYPYLTLNMDNKICAI